MKTESASVRVDLETRLQTNLLSHPRSQKGIFWLLWGTPSHCYSPQQSGREAENRRFQRTGLPFLLGSAGCPGVGCSPEPRAVRGQLSVSEPNADTMRSCKGRGVGTGVEPRAWGSWGARPTQVLEAVSIGRGWACEGGNVDRAGLLTPWPNASAEPGSGKGPA